MNECREILNIQLHCQQREMRLTVPQLAKHLSRATITYAL